MVLQVTGGANAYKDADGFLEIEEKEFDPPTEIWTTSWDFGRAKAAALKQARDQLLEEIHEYNRRELRRQQRDSSGIVADQDKPGFSDGPVNIFSPTMAMRWIDGDPNLSLADIKIKT
jgi:hypothetical protein